MVETRLLCIATKIPPPLLSIMCFIYADNLSLKNYVERCRFVSHDSVPILMSGLVLCVISARSVFLFTMIWQFIISMRRGGVFWCRLFE